MSYMFDMDGTLTPARKPMEEAQAAPKETVNTKETAEAPKVTE